MSEMKSLGVFVCVLVVTGLFGCASASKVAPEWVTNPESAYDSEECLWAVGSGASRKDAENDALSLLARSILQDVEASTETTKSMSGDDSSGYEVGYDYTGTVSVASNIKDIPGVTFPQSWIAGNGTAYTLALLNRQEAGRFYRQKIDELAAVVESEILFAAENKGTFKALAALNNAVAKARENQEYIDTLAGIHPDMYRMVSLGYESARAVEVLAQRQKDEIHVAVAVDGDSNDRVEAILESALTEAGLKSFPAVDSQTSYLLQGNVVMEKLKNDSKYEYVRFVVEVELRDAATGKVLLPYSKNGREAHITFQEATQRAYRTVEDALRKEFVPQFKAFIQER